MNDRMVGICAFKHCSNTTYTLSRWSWLTSLKNRCKRTDDACQCPPPFTLHTVLTEKRDLAARLKWTKAVNVAPPLSRKPQTLRQEPAQYNIDPSNIVEDVHSILGKDQQPQHNNQSYAIACNFFPAYQCVGHCSQHAKLKN